MTIVFILFLQIIIINKIINKLVQRNQDFKTRVSHKEAER